MEILFLCTGNSCRSQMAEGWARHFGADEHCPILPVGTRNIYWPLDDPAKATGSEERVTEVFRASRDDIKQRVLAMLLELQKSTEKKTSR